MGQRTVDAHNHWYPKEYLEYLMTRSDDETPYMRHDGGSHYRGYYKGVACCQKGMGANLFLRFSVNCVGLTPMLFAYQEIKYHQTCD